MSKTAIRGLALLSLALTLVLGAAAVAATSKGSSSTTSCSRKHGHCTPTAPSPTPTVSPTPSTSPTPTSAPTSSAPTSAPTSSAPTSAPTSSAPTSAPTSAAPTSTPTSTPTSSPTTRCTSPTWTTSQAEYRTWDDPSGVGTYGQYVVDNNQWNAGGYSVSQTLAACTFSSWSVTTTADNSSGDGAVKTYPNVHVDYTDWGTGKMQPLSDFSSLNMRFAHQAPTTAGIWNVAFDVWLNGVGNGAANELMIWTDNHNQVPAGTKVATVTLDGVEWAVWKAYSGHYLALVPTNNRVLTSGQLDLIPITQWLTANGYLPAGSQLGQVDYGVEIVSTNGQPARFDFTDFKVTETPR